MNPETRQNMCKALEKSMKDVMEALQENLGTLRTGRAHPGLIEALEVDAYGSRCPMTQMAHVSASGPRTLSVQVWDMACVAPVEKAIRAFGLNPLTEGSVLKIHLPEMGQEARDEMAKRAKSFGEKAKISLRQARRSCLELIDKKVWPEDEARFMEKDVQRLLDGCTKDVELRVAAKESEILKP